MTLVPSYADLLNEVFVASTQRASRAARSPPPSAAAETAAWETANAAAATLESRGLVRLQRLPPTEWARPQPGRRTYHDARSKPGGGGGGGGCGAVSHALARMKGAEDGTLATVGSSSLDAGAPARPTAQLSHVFSLQRPIDANAREASHIAYQAVLPLEAAQLAAAGMRSNSVRASVVHKPKKTCGGGQQTTRNNLGDMSASWAAQAVSVAIATGVAKYLCRTKHELTVSDPAATMALDCWTLVSEDQSYLEAKAKKVFIVTSTTRLLPHAMPTRVTAHCFLDTMRMFAQSEIEMGTIRQRVPQQVDALRAICHCIVDNTEGVNVWASWALLVHMLSDPRLRRMVQSSPISDLEAATAFVFQSYARAEITRRARMDVHAQQQQAKHQKQQAQPKQEKEQAQSSAQSDGKLDDDEDEDELDVPDYDDDDCDDAASVAPSTSTTNEADAASQMMLVQTAIDRRSATDKQTLSLKRKRPPNSGPAQPISGGFLEYWQAALHSSYAAILKMMITQSKTLANTAAVDTLLGQAPDGVKVHRNALLVDISCRNAVKSAEAISSLVVTPEKRVPKILTWRCRDVQNRIRCHVGIVRSTNDASNTTLHACRLAPKRCQPLRGTDNHIVCVWSHAVRNTTPRDNTTALLPGIMERSMHLHALESRQIRFESRHTLSRVFDRVKHHAARAASDGSLPPALTGVVRGIIVLRGSFVFGMSAVRAGVEIGDAMAAARIAAGQNAAFAPVNDYESCALLSQESLDPKTTCEPYATPSNNIALGLQVNEQLRVLMKNRSHRGDPCRHLCGVVTPQDLQEPSVEEFDKPQSLLPVVDCKIDMLEDPTSPGEALPNRRDACLRKAAVTLTVCGDAPVRLPELLDLFCAAGGPSTDVFFELTALTLAGAARASEVNDLANSVCAGHVNSSIASAKRILVGDLNLRPFLTLYDVYRVGTSNVPRSYETTPWTGSYGASFDIGTSGGIGIRASSSTADKRNHGKLLMSQTQVDAWCAAFAKVHYMKVSDTHYAPIPREVRGVPHYTVPGVHAYLDDYANGLERARGLIGVEAHRTVDSLQCMPFGPFSERQAPHVAENSDPTTSRRFRNPEDAIHADGRAFQVDATCGDVALFREPLVSNVAITAPQDNIFAQAAPFVTTAFGAMALIARQARTAFRLANPELGAEVTRPREELQLLHKLLCAFHHGTELPSSRLNHYIAATVCVALNVVFPASFGMAENVIRTAYARAPSIVHGVMASQAKAGNAPTGASLPWMQDGVLLKADVAEAQQFWAAFERKNMSVNAWCKLEPLLLKLLETNGSFDNNLSSLDAFWHGNDQLLRAATWMVASPDGFSAPLEPSPLAGVRSWTQVRSEHINPIFVGYTNSADKHVAERGSLIGVMPMGFQQILHLLKAVPRIPNIVVQYAHNFGYLIYRPSAAPDIMTSKNRERSSKAISCVNVEGDEAAFGTRQEKVRMCKLHRLAWRLNLDFVLPICTAIARPRSDAERARGDIKAVDYIKGCKRDLDAAGMHTKQEHEAAALFHQAVVDAQNE